MQTVNFQCGNCGKLMAVSVDFLGQQVRCPHCQQVVVAPAATASAASTPTSPDPFRTLAADSNDDIFSQRTEETDSLFGQADRQMQIPPDPAPAPPTPVSDLPLETTAPTLPGPLPAAADGLGPTISFNQPPPGEVAGAPTAVTESASLPWMQASPSSESPTSTLEGEGVPTPTVRRPRDESGRINWFIPLVFLPLILYAVLVTFAAGFLYLRIESKPPSMWEAIPDVDGDNPGVEKKAKVTFSRDQMNNPLPANLKVKLGESLRVGDLEVTPKKVERKTVKVFVLKAANSSEPLPEKSLVLTLEMRNLSDEYAFAPLDNYFDRRWDGKSGAAPLTVLVAGKTKWYGGPCKWYSMELRDKKLDREWLDLPGRNQNVLSRVGPGKSITTCVCTNGDKAGADLADYSGDLLWRIQVRRGVFMYKKKKKPAAAVIGVEFTAKDITN